MLYDVVMHIGLQWLTLFIARQNENASTPTKENQSRYSLPGRDICWGQHAPAAPYPPAGPGGYPKQMPHPVQHPAQRLAPPPTEHHEQPMPPSTAQREHPARPQLPQMVPPNAQQSDPRRASCGDPRACFLSFRSERRAPRCLFPRLQLASFHALNLCCLCIDVPCHGDMLTTPCSPGMVLRAIPGLRDGTQYLSLVIPWIGWSALASISLFPFRLRLKQGLYFEALLLSVESTMVGKGWSRVPIIWKKALLPSKSVFVFQYLDSQNRIQQLF